jgi:electron transfer flavoprotein alpha subunit
VAEGRAVEVLGAAGPLAGLVAEGVAAGTAPAGAAQVRVAPATDPGDGLRVVGSSEEAGGGGVATADRVVGVGRGLVAKADLALVESLAGVLHAAVACSLPLCDDLHWFDHTHVVGSSSQRISPRLYVAVGISGQPQHTTGIRGAKTVVAIDDDPDAPIFREAAYGIVGDLYAVVPALTAALAAS